MKNNPVVVTIVTVVLNAKDTIEKTIKSVINQSYKNIEYIVIDGGSTDGTLNIINQYREYISYFISETDNGIYDAMNKGIKKASGDIIGIINSDDWYERTTVENVVAYFKCHEVDLVYGNINVIDGTKISRIRPGAILDSLWYSMVTPHPTVFVKRKIYEKYGLFDTSYQLAADYELMLRYYVNGVKFGYLDEFLANFREGGQTTKRNNISVLETLEISKKFMHKSPCPQKVILENSFRKNQMEFLQICNQKNLYLKSILEKKVCNLENGIIIFGTGFWGEKIAEIVINNGIEIKKFADNNRKKWGTLFCNREILNPQELRYSKNFIIIAVKNNAEEIIDQLKSLNNKDIKWITLEDLMQYTINCFSVTE